jgi:hypothetical protein
MENKEIIITRSWPSHKKLLDHIPRYTIQDFEKSDMIKLNSMDKYNKWMNCINYKTNRKIKLNGPTYYEIKYELSINSILFTDLQVIDRSVLFTELQAIDRIKYLKETQDIVEKINTENNEIEKYNLTVYDVISKIKKLKLWTDYVEFEGIYYGIQAIIDNIHRTNDCFGEMIYFEETIKECRDCSGASSFSTGRCECNKYKMYTCNKCGYEIERIPSEYGRF